MLDKAYDPGPVESRWLQEWEAARLFHSEPKAGARMFSIVIPPPNVTGALHIGHALNNTLQDVLVRWHRLHGAETCWVPGTDHGGIATQNVMEKQLKGESLSRHALGREKFLERMQAWTRSTKSTILGQLKRLGCALDWQREAFTMDEARAKSVFSAFKALWDARLIYRGERMVNWCVRCGTALSDIEVEHEERKGKLWHIRYPAADGKGEGLVVATTRPETLLGDTAVAVNPRDNRYLGLVGRKLKLPLTGREIPIVGDEHVDATFGTGAVKVTPAHDPNDFEILQRHTEIGLRKVIGPDGKMTPDAGEGCAGLSREQARDKVLADLAAEGLLVKTEDHKNAVGVCYRCGSAIEPLLSLQWFVKMGDLAKPAIEALDKGQFKIHPQNWANPYREWLSNIKDWCVSRQIWWGHRIPVWYKESQEPVVAASSPGEGWTQDPDVLDTWFSSALWPMSVFGWPDKTEDLRFYYPTSVLVTGYEILYLWVARMQMMGLRFQGQPPFSDAIIHGIVRDKSGKKMSKSLGNVVDPLLMMDKYGTDALRFSLVVQAHPGRDVPFAEDSITGSRNFANKLWNSTRFVLMNLPERPARPYSLETLSHCCLELADKWILAEYQAALEQARKAMESCDVAAAGDALYGFLWDKFCDWYVELAKIRLQGIEGEEKESARAILVQVLNGTLKMLHPFMPYVTEELFAALKPYSGEMAAFVLKAQAPRTAFDWSNEEARRDMGTVMSVISELRALRAQLNVPPGLKIKVIAAGDAPESEALVAGHQGYVKALARVEAVEFTKNLRRPAQSATAVAAGLSFFVPLAGLIDFDTERQRLQKEAQKAEAELQKIAQKVKNPNFIARAPREEVATAEAQYGAAEARFARIKDTLQYLD